jgi:hypothetical protein
MLRRFSNLAIVIGFVLGVALPLCLFSSRPWTDPQELRTSASSPALPQNWPELLAYPSAFENFFDDHFGLRKKMLALRSGIDLRLFHRSSTPKVLVGRNDWLFYTSDKSVEDYRGDQPLTQEELSQWETALRERRDSARSHGVASYRFVVAPNKQSIYPENMPSSVVRAPHDHMDELVGYLAGKGEQSWLTDLRPSLWSRKEQATLYHPLDAHWNALGAYIDYRAMIDDLNSVGPRMVTPLDLPAKSFP